MSITHGKFFFTPILCCFLFISILTLNGVAWNIAKDDKPNNFSSLEKFFYRNEMRKFIQAISWYSHQFNTDFIIIPQNGIDLITINGKPEGSLISAYLSAIDGVGQEELFYGFSDDNKSTSEDLTSNWLGFLDRIRSLSKAVLIIDYCSSPDNTKDSLEKNNLHQFISFAADSRELDIIPKNSLKLYQENSENVDNIINAKNFLYFINPSNFSSKNAIRKYIKNKTICQK